MIICYLAGPIDYEADKGGTWKTELFKLTSGHKDIGFFDPCAPFKFGQVDSEMAAYIHDINMEALNRSDVLVGRLMKNQTSVGTPIEFYHVFKKKPMIILTDMAESVYMKYISLGPEVRFVKDLNEMYGSLIKLTATMEERKAKMRECRAELSKDATLVGSMLQGVSR